MKAKSQLASETQTRGVVATRAGARRIKERSCFTCGTSLSRNACLVHRFLTVAFVDLMAEHIEACHVHIATEAAAHAYARKIGDP